MKEIKEIKKTKGKYIRAYENINFCEFWSFGNIIAFDEYRDIKTIIVGKDNIPVENPDYSGSGYLTIPIEITKHLTNAFEFYEDILTDDQQPSVALDLKPDDKFIIKHFGKSMPNDWEITLWYDWGQFSDLTIQFPDKNETRENFNLDIKLDDIINYYDSLSEPRYYFAINFFVEKDKQKLQEIDKFKNNELNLPASWKSEYGGGSYGSDCINETMYFYGSKSKFLKAFLEVLNYYNNFPNLKVSEPSTDKQKIKFLDKKFNL